MKLIELIKQERFASTAQQVMLNVIVTSNWLLSELAAAMAPFGVTPAQYNVLRILRGSHPEELTCSEIGARLLDRTPDVTRLLNRLERNGWILRGRADYDRRVVEVRITEEGLRLLERMDPVVSEVQGRLTCHLDEHEQQRLSALLDQMRTDQEV